MIENKFLYFQTYSDFKNKLDAGQINGNSIAFIEDLSLIWTHGNEFGKSTQINLNEEDLAIVNDKIQFADKDFDPSVFSGLGRKYLRKNIVSRRGDDSSSDDSSSDDNEQLSESTDFINLLDDTMVNTPNTIYVVQYDYDLDGAILAIPENCVLRFDGGSIFNGTLIGQNTLVVYGKHKDECFKNVQLLGTWVSNDGPDLPIYAGSGSSSLKLNTTDNTASGTNSVAEGGLTTASGMVSHAEGYQTTAKGAQSHSEGRRTTVLGNGAHAEGYSTNKAPDTINVDTSAADVIAARSRSSFGIAYGIGSHNEGNDTVALGDYAHAEGEGTNATGQGAHSEGKSTHPIPEGTLAANLKAKWDATKFSCAWGLNSHAEGKDCLAEGDYSHSEGTSNYAGGNSSHAEGNGTTAINPYEHAEGQYNKSNTGTRHSVGIGTSTSGRKNAFEIMSDGKAFFYNLGGYNGTNPANAESIQTVISALINSSKSYTLNLNEGGTPFSEFIGYINTSSVADLNDSEFLPFILDVAKNSNKPKLMVKSSGANNYNLSEIDYQVTFPINPASDFDITFTFANPFEETATIEEQNYKVIRAEISLLNDEITSITLTGIQ